MQNLHSSWAQSKWPRWTTGRRAIQIRKKKSPFKWNHHPICRTISFLPRKYTSNTAMTAELKWNEGKIAKIWRNIRVHLFVRERERDFYELLLCKVLSLYSMMTSLVQLSTRKRSIFVIIWLLSIISRKSSNLFLRQKTTWRWTEEMNQSNQMNNVPMASSLIPLRCHVSFLSETPFRC